MNDIIAMSNIVKESMDGLNLSDDLDIRGKGWRKNVDIEVMHTQMIHDDIPNIEVDSFSWHFSNRAENKSIMLLYFDDFHVGINLFAYLFNTRDLDDRIDINYCDPKFELDNIRNIIIKELNDHSMIGTGPKDDGKKT